ncbi:MAG: hypothetical protein ACR2PA_13815 [Hyphomicrobiaceae bacterium]
MFASRGGRTDAETPATHDPRLIVSLGNARDIDEALRGLLLEHLRHHFTSLITIDATGSPESEFPGGTEPESDRLSRAGCAIWNGEHLLEQDTGDVFIAVEATDATDKAILYVRPRADYNLLGPSPFDRGVSLELTTRGVAQCISTLATLFIAVSPETSTDSTNSSAALADRIGRDADKLSTLIKGPLARLSAAEQTMTWHTYATCLHRLGADGDRLDLLIEATRYYQVSLNPLSRRTTPLQWVTIQNSLGVALCQIDRLSPSREPLQQAIEAFQAGLAACPVQARSIQRSALYHNCGLAHLQLYERSSDTACLEDAISSLEYALRVQPRDRAAVRRAAIADNLGKALSQLGTATKDTNKLIQAVNAYRTALAVRNRDTLPAAWIATQVSLGRALCSLGELQGGSYRLLEGTSVLRLAAQEIDRAQEPQYWADVQNALGSALLIVGRRERHMGHLYEAIAALSASLSGCDRVHTPAPWSLTQVKIGRAYHLLGKFLCANNSHRDREGGRRCLENAEHACTQALATYESLGARGPAQKMRDQISKINVSLNGLEDQI